MNVGDKYINKWNDTITIVKFPSIGVVRFWLVFNTSVSFYENSYNEVKAQLNKYWRLINSG